MEKELLEEKRSRRRGFYGAKTKNSSRVTFCFCDTKIRGFYELFPTDPSLLRSKGMLRHLAFRDYLREFPTIAAEYSHLKRQLHDTFQGDREAYMDGKHDFIQRTEKDALQWLTERSKNNTQVTDFTEL